jgi:ankyrin repeat protein
MLNRSKRPTLGKSKTRQERLRLLSNEDERVNMIWKSYNAETFLIDGLVRKRLGKVLGPAAKSTSDKLDKLKDEFDEISEVTDGVATIWTPSEVVIHTDEERKVEHLEIVSRMANGKSCFDLLECKRESGQKTFACTFMCPFLATKCLVSCVDALHNSPSKLFHGNIKPQNILLHFEPADIMDTGLADTLRTNMLETYFPTFEEISLVSNVYLADFDAESHITREIMTKKQDLKESESFDELPHFCLARQESDQRGDDARYLLTHKTIHVGPEQAAADDVWALASSIVTISTGVFLLRKENVKRMLDRTWTMEWEEKRMGEKAKHAWSTLPAAVRTLLKQMLCLDWHNRPTLQSLYNNTFLNDYKDAVNKGRAEYSELQVCCVEVAYHRWHAEQQLKQLEESVPMNAELDLKVGEALRTAAKEGDVITLHEILHVYRGCTKVVDNIDNSLNRTPLMLAASRGHTECVQLLIAHDANLEVCTKAHDTAVVFAIEHNHLEIVEMLVMAMERSKLVAANDRRWWTPLHYAVYHSRYQIIKMLLEKNIGGSARIRDASGRVPEEYVGYKVLACDKDPLAAEPKEEAILTILKKYKEQLVTKDKVGLQEEQENDHVSDSSGALFCEHEMTILDKFHSALHSRKLKAEGLLEAGLLRATILPVNPNVGSQMRLAAEQGSYDKLKMYLERYGHNPHLVDHADQGHGWTAAHVAAMRGNDKCLRLLHSYGASLCLPEKRGALPLHFAVINGHLSTTKLLLELLNGGEEIDPTLEREDIHIRHEVRTLLKKGYPLKTKSGSDWTPLHHAAAGDYVDIATLLVKCGADPRMKAADDKTCSDLVHSTHMALLFEKEFNRRDSRRLSGGERRRSSSGGFLAERRGSRRLESASPVIGGLDGGLSPRGSMGGTPRSTSPRLSMSMNAVGEEKAGDSRLSLADLSMSSPVPHSSLPPPPSIMSGSPRSARASSVTKRRSSSMHLVHLSEDDILHEHEHDDGHHINHHFEESPLTIANARPMHITFADGHSEVVIHYDDDEEGDGRGATGSPVNDFLKRNNVITTPHGGSAVPLPPSRSPSFSRRRSSTVMASLQRRLSSVANDSDALTEVVHAVPPSHLESAASMERRRHSAFATGAIPPRAQSPAGFDSIPGNDMDGDASTLASSEDSDDWSDDDDIKSTGAKSPQNMPPTPPGPSAVLSLFGQASPASPADADADADADGKEEALTPAATPTPTPLKKKRGRAKSLKDIDAILTKRPHESIILNYKSDIARTLFTITAQRLATPNWQQRMLEARGDEEMMPSYMQSSSAALDETAKGAASMTVVTLTSLHNGNFNHNRARQLIDALWEAADSGARDRLMSLLKQVGPGPKARHFNVVGGAAVFDINNLEYMDSKCVCSPLYAACKKGHIECARLLLEAGADPGYQDREGMTPLHMAAIWGRIPIIRMLAEAGADIDQPDLRGNTALHKACFKYTKASIALLIELGCDVTVQNKAGKRADEATKYGAARTAIKLGVKKRGW